MIRNWIKKKKGRPAGDVLETVVAFLSFRAFFVSNFKKYFNWPPE
jgi:hypothetical protein